MSAFGLTNTVFNYFGDHSPRVITANVTSAATGKRFVSVVAGGTAQVPNVAQTGAGLASFGVLDGDVTSAQVTAKDNRRAVWQESSAVSVTAGASLTAGQGVQSDAEGRAVPHTTGVRLGTAFADATTGSDAAIHIAL